MLHSTAVERRWPKPLLLLLLLLFDGLADQQPSELHEKCFAQIITVRIDCASRQQHAIRLIVCFVLMSIRVARAFAAMLAHPEAVRIKSIDESPRQPSLSMIWIIVSFFE